MAIRSETKRMYEVIGEIRFDDGKGDPIVGMKDGIPFWLARPMGWSDTGVDILLSGDLLTPDSDSVERAVQVFQSLDKIEKEGRDLIRPKIMSASSQGIDVTHYEAALLWIDCQQRDTIVVFNWEGFPYVR